MAGDACISIQAWAGHFVLAALAAGVAIGLSLRIGLDYSELAAYRRIARQASEREVGDDG